MRSRLFPYVTHVRQHTKPSNFGVGSRVLTAPPSLVMPGKGIYTGPDCHSVTLHTQLYLHFVTHCSHSPSPHRILSFDSAPRNQPSTTIPDGVIGRTAGESWR